MNDVIITALIGASASVIAGVLTLVGVLASNNRANRDIQARLEISQAVTDTKIDSLTREVREHNNFAKRVPIIEEQVKSLNTKILNLEKYHIDKEESKCN